jgi:selenocysteine-specific elongation factor
MNTGRRNLMLGTAGHVDHGKTALVKLLTGCETDTMAEEKERGLTIDLGFAPCRLADQRVVGIVDVPGHADFIRNMVAGAHGIDVVIFVVAADDGIMPQTHEHLHILTLMGLRHGLVALTKVDVVDDARRQFVVQDLRRLLANTFLADAPICPLSNLTGEGFDGFFEALNRVVAACEDRPCTGWFRVWVEDVFTIRGCGTVITGIPTRGRVRVGDTLHVLPAGLSGHVRRLQVYGADADEGRAGECVALNLPELDHLAVRRGMLLSEVNVPAPVTMAEAELRLLDALPGRIEDYLEVQLHVGTASVTARVAMLESTEMAAGQRQMVQLRLAEPLALAPGERYVVRANVAGPDRSGLSTLGGGRMLGLSNVRLRRKRPWTIDTLTSRRDALEDQLRWCALMLREKAAAVTAADLEPHCMQPAAEIAALLDRLQAEGTAVRTPRGACIHRAVVDEAAARMLAELRTFHVANPQRAGYGRDALQTTLKVPADVFDLATALLVGRAQVAASGSLLAVAGWKPQLTDRDQRLSNDVEARLQRGGWTPPSPEELAAAVQEPAGRLNSVFRLLAESGRILRLDERIWMHRGAVEAGKQTALKLFRRAPAFTTMDFRDALGVSRKFAVPLLDHLDKVRFTVRSGNHRTPGVEAKRMLAVAEDVKREGEDRA